VVYQPLNKVILDHIITGISNSEISLPAEHSLSQNYPNPFNPSTSIKYKVGSIEYVTLKIYDVLGREAAVLVNEVKKPGEYKVEWNASQLVSGVYYYRLTAGSFSDTKKFVLMK
jgi:hypothetical protein